MNGILLAAALGACDPPVDLQGEDAIRRSLEMRLAADGVPVGAGDPDCPALQVRVVREAAGLSLEGSDVAGRLHRRRVQDPAVAVALIEGWRSRKLQAPLLAIPDRPRDAPSPWRIRVAAELGRNDAGGWERGASLAALRAIDPIEGRVVLRWADVDPQTVGGGRFAHALGEALIGAGLPLGAGAFRVTPAAALGIGWDRSARAACIDGCTRLVPDDAWSIRAAMRAQAGIELAFDLGRMLAIEAELGASISPFASDAPIAPAWAPESEAGAFGLAAPPRSRLRAGIALAWRPP